MGTAALSAVGRRVTRVRVACKTGTSVEMARVDTERIRQITLAK